MTSRSNNYSAPDEFRREREMDYVPGKSESRAENGVRCFRALIYIRFERALLFLGNSRRLRSSDIRPARRQSECTLVFHVARFHLARRRGPGEKSELVAAGVRALSAANGAELGNKRRRAGNYEDIEGAGVRVQMECQRNARRRPRRG